LTFEVLLPAVTMQNYLTGLPCMTYCPVMASLFPFYTEFLVSFDMDMSYTRVLHIKVAYRVPHK
jgi:hypothetical protein